MAIRASTPEHGFYCRFRGDQTQVIEMLRMVLAVLERAPAVSIDSEVIDVSQNN